MSETLREKAREIQEDVFGLLPWVHVSADIRDYATEIILAALDAGTRRAPSPTDAGTWQPTATAPKHVEVLLWLGHSYFLATHGVNGWVDTIDGDAMCGDPNNWLWRPLPAPPAHAGDGAAQENPKP